MTTMIEEKRDQAREALAAANEKRSQRARLKRQVADGEIPVAVVVLEPPEFLATTSSNGVVTVADVLSWEPGVGRQRALTMCRRLRIPPSIELTGLSQTRRAQLARAVGV